MGYSCQLLPAFCLAVGFFALGLVIGHVICQIRIIDKVFGDIK